jgi:hypothetical protein
MRDISVLHPTLQLKIAQLKAECAKQGLKIGIGECYRTVAEQDKLYAQGRTTPGKKVTNAKGSSYSSMHQWYVAFDFFRNDGKQAFDNKDKFFNKVGKIGKDLGLIWGGSWLKADLPHFQLKDWGNTPSKLKKQYGTPEKFRKTWSNVPVATSNANNTNIKERLKAWELVFNPSYYYSKYADLRNAGLKTDEQLLDHFVTCGVDEGRQGISTFNPQIYKERYRDLQASFGNNMRLYYLHYIQSGVKEGRSGI